MTGEEHHASDVPPKAAGASGVGPNLDDVREATERLEADAETARDALARSLEASTTALANKILETPNPPGRIDKLSSAERIEKAKADQADQANHLRTGYGVALLLLIVLQIALVDAVFIAYASWGAHWNVPATILNVWVGATVVQVLGIIAIVVHYLFPNQDRSGSDGGASS